MDKINSKAVFLSHGGGPLPLLNDPGHEKMNSVLKDIANTINKPEAIIVISAHWEENTLSITGEEESFLIYDYYGFPKESYDIQYPAPAHPVLAKEIYSHLKESGLSINLKRRGWDHGLFVPLKIMYPEADIPCIQISLYHSLSPKQHIDLGKALSSFPLEGTLIMGSGFSFHNMHAFFSPLKAEEQFLNQSFESWLVESLTNKGLSEEQREQRLINWEKAKGARFSQPREEHLLPLHVCYGLAQSAAVKSYEYEVMKIKTSAFIWE